MQCKSFIAYNGNPLENLAEVICGLLVLGQWKNYLCKFVLCFGNLADRCEGIFTLLCELLLYGVRSLLFVVG